MMSVKLQKFNYNDFSWPSERWHMVQKMTTLTFRSEIPHDELINVIYFFCSDLLLFSRKFSKNCTRCRPLQKWRTLCASMNTRTSLVKNAKASSLFFSFYIYVRSIGRLFTPKTRILCPILNSRRVFIKISYILWLKNLILERVWYVFSQHIFKMI